jgi:hypothetical protein
LFPVHLHDFLIHPAALGDVRFSLFVPGSDGLDFGLELLHFGHGAHAAVGQGKEEDFDDEGDEDDSQTPVGDNSVEEFTGFEKDFRDKPEHPESDQFFRIMAKLDQSVEFLRPDKNGLGEAHGEEKIGVFLRSLPQKGRAGLLAGGEEESGEVVVFIGRPLDKEEDILVQTDQILPFFCQLVFLLTQTGIFSGRIDEDIAPPSP